MKYELIKEGTYYRLKALKCFHFVVARREFTVEAGELGGLVKGDHNLSQEGSCWIAEGAKVEDNARVVDSAVVINYAWIGGITKVCGNITINK